MLGIEIDEGEMRFKYFPCIYMKKTVYSPSHISYPLLFSKKKRMKNLRGKLYLFLYVVKKMGDGGGKWWVGWECLSKIMNEREGKMGGCRE